MTATAINIFQPMFTFKSFAFAGASKQEIKLAVWLKREAQNLAAVADDEMRSGQAAQNLAAAAKDSEKARVFTEIAVWHHNRAAEKYRKSAARFQEAAAIQTGKRREFNAKAKETIDCCAKAEATVNLLTDRSQN